MPEPWLIREARPDDLSARQRFHRECFGRELDLDRFRWLHQEGPAGPARDWLALSPDGEVIGTYSLLPLPVWLGGAPELAFLAVAAAVHPAWRRRGLFVALGRTLLEAARPCGAALVLGKPNRSALPGHRRVGWRELRRLPKLWKRPGAPGAHGCQPVERFDPRLDAFHRERVRGVRLAVRKDARWLEWRLGQPGAAPEYRRFILSSGDTLRGYAVAKRYLGAKGPVCHLLELVAEDPAARAQLVAAAEEVAQGCLELNLWANPPDPPLGDWEPLGFSLRDDGEVLIGYPLREPLTLEDPGGIWFSFADNDIH